MKEVVKNKLTAGLRISGHVVVLLVLSFMTLAQIHKHGFGFVALALTLAIVVNIIVLAISIRMTNKTAVVLTLIVLLLAAPMTANAMPGDFCTNERGDVTGCHLLRSPAANCGFAMYAGLVLTILSPWAGAGLLGGQYYFCS